MSKVIKQIVFKNGTSVLTYSEPKRDEAALRPPSTVAFVVSKAVGVPENHPSWSQRANQVIIALEEEVQRQAVIQGVRLTDATPWELREMGKWNVHDYREGTGRSY